MCLLTKRVKPGERSWYVDYATRYTIRGSNSSRKKEIFIFCKAPRPAMGQTSFLLNECRAVKRAGRVEYHSPPSTAQIRMSGAIVLLPIYSFIAWTGTTLIFYHFARLYFMTSTYLLPILILHSRIFDFYISTNTKKRQRNLFPSNVIFLLSKH